jgi:hypothetical protein
MFISFEAKISPHLLVSMSQNAISIIISILSLSAETVELRYDVNGPDRDCGDFNTHAEAQAFFEAAGGPQSDRHRLDDGRVMVFRIFCQLACRKS